MSRVQRKPCGTPTATFSMTNPSSLYPFTSHMNRKQGQDVLRSRGLGRVWLFGAVRHRFEVYKLLFLLQQYLINYLDTFEEWSRIETRVIEEKRSVVLLSCPKTQNKYIGDAHSKSGLIWLWNINFLFNIKRPFY